MKLQEVFDQLSAGELSQFYLGGENGSGIVQEDYPKVIPLVNLGLIELYKRFSLMKEEVTIQLKDGKTRYLLDSKHSVRNTDPSVLEKYIVDSEFRPFKDNIIEVERVYDELGVEHYNNHLNVVWGVSTPEYNVIECLFPSNSNTLTVIYSGFPESIQTTITDASSVDINLPHAFMEALVLYIGTRLYSGIRVDGDNGSTLAYQNRFENACNQLKKLNFGSDGYNINVKLDNAGFV